MRAALRRQERMDFVIALISMDPAGIEMRIRTAGRLGGDMFDPRLRYLFAALTLSFSLFAWSVSAHAQNAEALPGVAGVNTEGSWGLELGFDWKRDRALLIDELKKSGVVVAPFEAGPDDVPRFLTGKLHELRCARNARQFYSNRQRSASTP